eukprot:5086637-Karenia_brevis.AAC.1
MATMRAPVRAVEFEQNIGFMVKRIVVCTTQSHCGTMKGETPTAYNTYWDCPAGNIMTFRVNKWAGDFNMAFCDVIYQLRSRRLTADCIAWYPRVWMDSRLPQNKPLGIESCGIVYIGGNVHFH